MSTTPTTVQPEIPPSAPARRGFAQTALRRPEVGALVAAVAVALFFGLQSPVFRSATGVANWLDPAATLGIMAVAIALLMIGGEFDLSAGVMTGTTALTTALLVTRAGWNIWAALAASLVLALAVGFTNGYLVVTTKLPSFIVTLASFLFLQGLNLGGIKLLTGTTQVSGVSNSSGYVVLQWLFASSLTIGSAQFGISILWWILITAGAAYLLQRTPAGNWVFAVGGDQNAARAVGVPVNRVKIALFMTTAAAGWFVGNMILIRLDSVQATTGIGQELIYVVAAVIGGCLLTGGYGSALGAAIGALIFGMAQLGIVYLRWDSDWFKAFLGIMLLLAVLGNQLARRLLTRR
jgi:simple sugar transport system permease protein